MRKKLLFITTRLFFTTNSGRKLSLYHYCRGLYEKYDYDIYIYSFLEGDQIFDTEVTKKPYFIKEVYCAEEVKFSSKLINLLFKSLLSSKWPLQCSLYYSKKNVQQINRLCEEHGFDVAITDMIRTAPYIEALNRVPIRILDMDDLLSKRYERELASDYSDPNFIGQYSKKLPRFANKIIPLIKKRVLKIEISKLKYSEVYYGNLYDKVIFVSDLETSELNQKLNERKCVTIPTGVDYEYFSAVVNKEQESNALSFIGNMEYPPNIDSLRIIVNKILPYVSHPVKLYVVGKVTDKVKSEFNDKVIFLGMAEDLRSTLKLTTLFVSPIAYGSGIKTKILEAMAMGLPVLTNSVGAEGINIVSGKNAIVSNDLRFLAAEIDRLLDNKEERIRIGNEAQELIKSQHQWEDIWKHFSLCGLGD